MFLGYAAVGVLAFLFVKALVPETTGRSLEEIESDLQQKAHRRDRDRAVPAGVR